MIDFEQVLAGWRHTLALSSFPGDRFIRKMQKINQFNGK